MNKSRFFVTSLVTILLAGCIPSLHAIYSEKDVIFDPQLVGVWKPKDGDGTWQFTKRGDKAYQFVCTENDGDKGNFTAHLTRLGDVMFLDIAPDKDQIASSDFHRTYLLPLHTFFRVDELSSSHLKLSTMDFEALKRYLAKNPDALPHQKIDNDVLVTASTAELQKFVTSTDAKGMFTELGALTRHDPQDAEQNNEARSNDP